MADVIKRYDNGVGKTFINVDALKDDIKLNPITDKTSISVRINNFIVIYSKLHEDKGIKLKDFLKKITTL